jgi:hypothetical protein
MVQLMFCEGWLWSSQNDPQKCQNRDFRFWLTSKKGAGRSRVLDSKTGVSCIMVGFDWNDHSEGKSGVDFSLSQNDPQKCQNRDFRFWLRSKKGAGRSRVLDSKTGVSCIMVGFDWNGHSEGSILASSLGSMLVSGLGSILASEWQKKCSEPDFY